jgi:hypothetical protein
MMLQAGEGRQDGYDQECLLISSGGQETDSVSRFGWITDPSYHDDPRRRRNSVSFSAASIGRRTDVSGCNGR